MITNNDKKNIGEIVDLTKCKHLAVYNKTQYSAIESFTRQSFNEFQRLQERYKETEKIANNFNVAYKALASLLTESHLILSTNTREQINQALVLLSQAKCNGSKEIAEINLSNSSYCNSRILQLLEIEKTTNE